MQRVHRIQDLERHICFAKREQFVCTGFVFLQVSEGMIKEVSLRVLRGRGGLRPPYRFSFMAPST